MRCRRVRKIVLEEGAKRSSAVVGHLRSCTACASYARHWESIRKGLSLLAAESVPEARLGFSARVGRALAEASTAERVGEVFLERAGRRFIYAALLATVLLLMGLMVPRSSPVRSESSADLVSRYTETAAAQNYPIYSGQLMDNDFEFAAQPGGR